MEDVTGGQVLVEDAKYLIIEVSEGLYTFHHLLQVLYKKKHQ